jgi:hypothetical protein
VCVYVCVCVLLSNTAVVNTGGSCCIMAYGATGSGKTHTLTGSTGETHCIGLLHMIAEELCTLVQATNAGCATPAQELSIFVTGGEVYQEELLDLGPASSSAAGDYKVKRMSTATLKRVPVATCSPVELVDSVAAMLARRAAGATNKNAHSSRSHAVFTIGLERGGVSYASLALVDLAGAEYAAATEGREDVRRLEGGKNNLGLMTLKAAFRHVGASTTASSAAKQSEGRFSWHRSKLTAALRPFFTDEAGRMLLLITASPDAADAAQTSQTLEEGVAVAGRTMAAKTVVEIGAPPPPPPRFLRSGEGRVLGGKGAPLAAVQPAVAAAAPSDSQGFPSGRSRLPVCSSKPSQPSIAAAKVVPARHLAPASSRPAAATGAMSFRASAHRSSDHELNP